MNTVGTYLLFVVIYSLVIIGVYVFMRRELRKIKKGLKKEG
jgi:multisubunit Na+/H+ antiporter MnhC subunit